MRPHVVYNNVTRQFVLWYEDRPESGYSVATSQNPGGPFKTIHSNISMPGTGRIGDFDLFVDNDGVAYHIRTGFDIVQLDSTYTGVDQLVSSFKTPESTEAPILFRRDDMYYAFVGRDCCYCLGGSNVFWLTASSIRGPWTLRGDVGSNPGPFDPHSPNNYVTRGQGQKVFPVHTRSGPSLLYLGCQWGSGLKQHPPGPRHHDLFFWQLIQFSENGSVIQFEFSDSVNFELVIG